MPAAATPSVGSMTPRSAGRAGALTLLAVTMLTVAGCAGMGAKLTYTDTEKSPVNAIDIAGHSGDVIVTTAAVTATTITRTIRDSTDPQVSYRLDGTTLHLDTRCGSGCTVSYQIEAPAGVAVTGQLGSGDVQLTDVGSADVAVTSGDILVRGATGAVKARATSGDITVTAGRHGATLEATSGDVHAVDITGGPVVARVGSGDVTVQLGQPASVTAQAGSGDVQVTVPAGPYQLHTQKGSGDLNVAGITDSPTAVNVLNLKVGSGDVTLSAA